jgi:ubiquinone/menaquinone biosynthesis C-methylase UbiE
MATKQYYFTLKGLWKRTKDEYNYYTKRPWTLEQVGKFWDTVEDYDEVNAELYPYFRRFTNSYELAEKYLPRNDYKMLDLQARSGKGSLFWHQHGKLAHSTCVDFSDYLASLADRRLQDSGLDYKSLKVLDFPLPFENEHFDFISCYETVEHVHNYNTLIHELTRVIKKDNIMIVTCPNRSWEWVHWLTAAININHSEGPHRFIARKKLLQSFRNNNLTILEENTTIILPFNNKLSIKMDKFLEKNLPEWIKRYIALRRTFVLRKD